MYRVLIVDDEPEIRQGLRLKIDWEQLGLTIAGEAGNGVEAMEKLADEGFDIAITDMNMPLMNGVSLLKACHEQHPELRLLIITGYEDIHYAKAAVRHQAKDYLLKPVARTELTEALTRLRQELDTERVERGQASIMQWRMSQYYMEMKEHLIVHLVKEKSVQERDMLEQARLFQLHDWDACAVRFMTIGLRERSSDLDGQESVRTPEKLRLPFELVCRENVHPYAEAACIFHDPNYPGLMHIVSTLDDKRLAPLTDTLKSNVFAYIGMEPFVGIGHSVTGFKQWGEGYLSALLTWKGKPSLMDAVQQYIDDNYMFDLNLTMIAERFNYNPSYFSEMFKAKAGKTFIQYLTDIRMVHAARLLEETKLGLWEIAELTGFSNASYFSTKFKRMYGMSPSEYRQRQPEKFKSEEPKK
ncbi:response regulator transcription factor [Paenibacillus medicaginis]|uniref:Response regulator n=1 Tax=Paenibacillus medicaginis TaxID=1470560 RepID=A0ABV5BZQ9_9BACL